LIPVPAVLIFKEKKMPQITFNDEQVEAKAGEKLLAVARRNALHIGFACDGRGLCKTCTTHVLSGGDNVGPLTEIEKQALSEPMQKHGYRLACQTTVTDQGTVEVVSRAEELRRKATGVVTNVANQTPFDSIISLIGSVGQLALDYVGSVPYIATNIIPRFKKMPIKLHKVQTILQDAGRVCQRVVTNRKTPFQTNDD